MEVDFPRGAPKSKTLGAPKSNITGARSKKNFAPLFKNNNKGTGRQVPNKNPAVRTLNTKFNVTPEVYNTPLNYLL
jgi:hypothetical protein